MRSRAGSRGVRVVPVVLVGLAALVVGCKPGGSEKAPLTPPPLSDVLWNPCTDLSDDVLRVLRVNPADKHVGIDSGNPTNAAAKSCSWNSTEGPYGVGVGAERFSLADVRKNKVLLNFRDVRVGSRPGLMYQDNIATNDGSADPLTCYVSVPYKQGSIDLFIYWSRGEESKASQLPPCDIALSRATDLVSYLPQ
ncbi:DUF3558 domain-containing protein [Nocardia panacis]|uniref:DUF3558 domain-containing protein n=1 Tax=Nocardia panacis TaxID=2340916 RepID=A0A3A4KY06_9NOCA|nr:DUF3558 domain-containing protein [Nocardia panacis]RJO78705.1 DUF3558 domain-containing protein [Nocardia panacis]